ncbi:EmrB/QacA subfamily drug resistance transporter [Lipingzhangella halophila]|uniref:EmrB/QacA subfamily drug resistance transporter n=1 Tax=Lipingzhangella halophila TaxID=1783352 RepID=A0A7W7REC5_9ACTN|nr:MFS transporter [Lipingzhangella halophila]MBB4930438.1 EmrB/QacA subfamily drug resistance transporter [Lipingzhangella halophila]
MPAGDPGTATEGDASPASHEPPFSRTELRYAWRVLSVTVVGTVLFALNTMTLNVALPTVVAHFDAGPFAASWLLMSYMLVSSVTLVIFGRLADVFGRRESYLSGMAIFVLASLLQGLAPNVWVVVALRAMQAIGGAMILANSTALITQVFPRPMLGRALGIYMGAISTAQILGPTVGGLIADLAGWRWVFWFNVPLGLFGLLWAVLSLRKFERGSREPVDVPGSLLLLCWLGGLLLALSEAGARGWSSPVVIAGSVAALVTLPLFVLVEWRTRHPVIQLRIFGDLGFTIANLAAFLNTLGRFSLLLIMALFFQTTRGLDPAAAGLAILPMPLGMALGSPLAGYIAGAKRHRLVAVLGSALAAVGVLVLALTVESAPYGLLACGLALTGFGTGVFLTANTTVIMATVPDSRLGAVNGLRLTLQNIGNVLSVAMSLTLIATALDTADRHLVYASQEVMSRAAPLSDLVAGYHRTLLVLFGISVLGTLAALFSRATQRSRP